jgi:hypothetical protein
MSFRHLSVFAACLALGLVACSEPSTTALSPSPSPTPTPSFTLALSPTTVTMPQSSTVTVQVGIERTNGFAAAVALSVAGAPEGVTATFDSASVSGNQAALTLAASGASLGTSTLTVTAASGSTSKTATVSLTVTEDDFGLALTTDTFVVPQGASIEQPITVIRREGFTGPISLSLLGSLDSVVAGVTPTVTGSEATLSLFATNKAPIGSLMLTLKGTGGDTTVSVPFTVAIVPPDVALTATPSSVEVPVGETVQQQITIQRQPGFTGPVTLEISNLPQGVTVSIEPNPVMGDTATATYTAAGDASESVLDAFILGTGGNTPVTTRISVAVAPPLPVTIDPVSGLISISSAQQFTATVGTNPSAAVTWSVNGIPGGDATVGTITADGLYTAPAVRPHPIAVTVTATSVAAPSQSAAASVTITAPGILYVTDTSTDTLSIFPNASTVDGDVAPARSLTGDQTQLDYTTGAFVDAANDRLYVPLFNAHKLLTFTGLAALNGNVAPTYVLSGPQTQLASAEDVEFDPFRWYLYVGGQSGKILVFDALASLDGDVAPVRIIEGDQTQLAGGDTRLFLDTLNDRLYVAQAGGHSILVFDSLATLNGNVAPARVLEGAATGLECPWGVTVDTGRDLLYVSDYCTNVLKVFANASTVSGDVAPVRTISIGDVDDNYLEDLWLDPETDRLAMQAEGNNLGPAVFFFEGVSSLDGVVLPARILRGAQTTFDGPQGITVDWDR